MNKHVRVHMELNKVFYGGKIISFTLCPFNPQRTSWMDPKTAMDGKKKIISFTLCPFNPRRTSWMDPKTAMDGKKKHYKLRALPV